MPKCKKCGRDYPESELTGKGICFSCVNKIHQQDDTDQSSDDED